MAPVKRPISLDRQEFPDSEYAARRGAQTTRPACNGPIQWRNFAIVEKDIANLQAATAGISAADVFMTTASPGTIANHHPNQYYANREVYLAAIADVMKREYEAIATAGFILQLDCPDLALHHLWFPGLSAREFRDEIALNVEALNHATRDIPSEQMRMHVCWGAGEGPHNHDIELKEIVDMLLRGRPVALSIVAANGRHEHEWRVWQDVRPRAEGKLLIPGVIDNTTNIIEHPEVVAERSCGTLMCAPVPTKSLARWAIPPVD